MNKSIANRVSENKYYKELKAKTERGSFLYKVYGLIDPRDNKLFYVGCTRELIYFRIYNHFTESKETKKKEILLDLLDSDLFPNVEVLYEFEEREYAYLIEKYITNFVHNFNFEAKLTNHMNIKKKHIIDDAKEWC